MKPHVVHMVDFLDLGGLERLVCDLSVARGSDFTSVICLRSGGAFAEGIRQKGVRVDVVDWECGLWQRATQVVRLLRSHQPDVLHCHDPLANRYGAACAILLGAMAARRPPVVGTMHLKPPIPSGVRGAMNRWLLRRIQVVGNSAEVCETMQSWIGNTHRLVRYVANGIPLQPFDHLPPRREARAALDLPEDAFIVGIVARLEERKGHLRLVQAFARLRAEVPHAALVIVGDGEMRTAIESEVRTLGVESSVFSLGRRLDVPQILAAFDVYCLPSDNETLPLAILEAMAASLPVVVGAVGAIPTAVEDGISGLLIPPHDAEALVRALLTVARDPVGSAAMGHAARRRVEEKFSLAMTLNGYEELYRERLDPPGGS